MEAQMPSAKDDILTVVYRVESGCLGPAGEDHIADFCQFVAAEFETEYTDFIQWVFMPRDDKSMPEIVYKIADKNLSAENAARYLSAYNQTLEEFEDQLHGNLFFMIDSYMDRLKK